MAAYVTSPLTLPSYANRGASDLCFSPPYCTSAICPADQDPNFQAEKKWDSLRKNADSLNHLHALDMAHEIWEHAFTEKFISNGFRKCGLLPNQKIDRSQVFGARANELFRSILPCSELAPQTEEGKSILERPKGYKRAPARSICSECGERTPCSLPRCGYCGAQNLQYDQVADVVHSGYKHGGYTKSQPQIENVDEALAGVEASTKANLARWSGDLIGEMRTRKATEQGAEVDHRQRKWQLHPRLLCLRMWLLPHLLLRMWLHHTHLLSRRQLLPLLLVSWKSSAIEFLSEPCCLLFLLHPPKRLFLVVGGLLSNQQTLAFYQGKKADPEEAPTEFDLEDSNQCSLFIQMHFPKERRGQVRKVADFFLQSLKKDVCKKQFFSDLFHMKVINAQLLKSKASRAAWMSAWQSNRNKRFVTLTLPAKSK